MTKSSSISQIEVIKSGAMQLNGLNFNEPFF
jgi:hypothetical protein